MSYDNTSNLNSQISFTDNDFIDSDCRNLHSIEERDTSIISSHYEKAKKLYTLKKIFNRNRMKVYFDMYVIGTFGNW